MLHFSKYSPSQRNCAVCKVAWNSYRGWSFNIKVKQIVKDTKVLGKFGDERVNENGGSWS